jgi:aminopeptidase N
MTSGSGHKEFTANHKRRVWRLPLVAVLAGALLAAGLAVRADEPYARSRDYDLTNSKISLRFDVDQRKVMGEVTHSLAALRDGLKHLDFDSVELKIESVTLNGKPAKFDTTQEQLRVELTTPSRMGEKYELTVRYEGKPKKGLYFILPDKNYPDRPKEIWTQGEAEDTRYYIPIYDYPNDRLTTEMILTVPREWETVSNGKLVSKTDTPDGMRTWDWKESLPHSTYLISVVAGEFQMSKMSAHNVPIFEYVPRGRAERIPPTASRLPQMIDHFGSLVGVPYPWEKYSEAWVDDFVEGGMENTSATTQTSSLLVHPLLASESPEQSDFLISHELAHQWFGDLVTCKDWANVWLNEGFATYFETAWEEHQYGADAASYTLWQNRNQWMAGQRQFSVPIVTHEFTDSIEYAGNVYTKAGWVLDMLRYQLGDAQFYRALKHYLERNRGQNVVTADLVKAIEEATSVNVDRFFDQWIYGAGAPRFQVASSYDEGTRQLKLSAKQTQKIEGHVGIFNVPVEIEVTTAAGKRSFPVELSKAEETFSFTLDGPPVMILFDKGDKVLKSVAFDKPAKDWIYQLQHADTVPDRADAARALGAIKNDDAVIVALGDAALHDKFYGIRTESIRALGRIGGSAVQAPILAATNDSLPWVRAVAVTLTGGFTGNSTVTAKLEDIYKNDRAFSVRAAALGGIGQQKPADAFELLSAAANTDSPDDRLKTAALRAMGTLGDDRAVPLLLEASATGKPFGVRSAAISSLGRLDKKNKEITARVVSYMQEGYFSLRGTSIRALGERGDPDAIVPLEQLLKAGDSALGNEDLIKQTIAKLKMTANGGVPANQ